MINGDLTNALAEQFAVEYPNVRLYWAWLTSVSPLQVQKFGETVSIDITASAVPAGILRVGDNVLVGQQSTSMILLTSPKAFQRDYVENGPEGANLNDYQTPGTYAWRHNSFVLTGSNFPIAHAGVLEVSATPIPGMVWQRYTTYFGVIWHRCYYSVTGWTAWTVVSGVAPDWVTSGIVTADSNCTIDEQYFRKNADGMVEYSIALKMSSEIAVNATGDISNSTLTFTIANGWYPTTGPTRTLTGGGNTGRVCVGGLTTGGGGYIGAVAPGGPLTAGSNLRLQGVYWL